MHDDSMNPFEYLSPSVPINLASPLDGISMNPKLMKVLDS